jgi:NADH-quinone oxidoreductase subunit C
MAEERQGGAAPEKPPEEAAAQERARRREEALAQAAQRRRQREGAVQRSYEPSPLEAQVRSALQGLASQIEYSLDELVARVPPDRVVEACRVLKETPGLEFAYLRCLSVVDYGEELEVLYHLSSLAHPHKAIVKARAPAAEPRIPSAVSVWRGADWHEREAHDLFGVVFEGHPNLAPLLPYEGFEGFPLRKSYLVPEQQEVLGG